MPDYSWTLHGIEIDAVATQGSPSHPAVSPGREREWTFLFQPDGTTGAFTVGSSAVGSASIGTGYDTRHADLLDIAESAQRSVVAWENDTNAAVTYHETVATDAPVATYVAELRPNGDIGRPSRWVLVAGGVDASPPNGALRRARLRLVDLARGNQYADVSAVQTALEEDTI